MLHALFAISCSFLLSVTVTPLMIFISKKRKIYDIPDARKNHKKPTPLLGGIAIYLATMLTVFFSLIFFSQGLQTNIIVAFIIGISGVTLMGAIDDILSLSVRKRLIILFALALIVLVGCLQFYFEGRFTEQSSLIFISIFIMLWVVAITNAINFSDGLDGLAGCLSLISAAAFAIVFHFQGRTQLALPTVLALCGAIFGFLPYNLNPAKIFMGDAGSMFIGFMLGILSIMSMSQQNIIFCIVPIYFLLVPLMDMFMVILRRLIIHHPIMKPDNQHIHHKLYNRFQSHNIVVFIFAVMQIIFAGFGILVYFTKAYIFGWLVLAIVVVGACLYTVISINAERQKKAGS